MRDGRVEVHIAVGALKSLVGWVLMKPRVVEKPQSPSLKRSQRFLAWPSNKPEAQGVSSLRR
jgi:hypothetical protein